MSFVFFTVENEEVQYVEKRLELILYFLSIFENSRFNVVALTAYSNATNGALSPPVCHIIVCGSHRYDLADKEVVDKHDDIVKNIKCVISK